MNTDYNLYKIFLYLFEEKSISKTASKLYVSQPAISYSLKELENQLGYTLFYRNSKGIEPTIEAKELYNYISTAFNILNDAEEHIKNLNQLNTGCIRVGIPPYLGVFFLLDVMGKFRKEFPGIQFEIVCESTKTMLEMLETRKLDIVFDALPIDSKKDVKKVTLTKFRNCFAYYKNEMSGVVVKNVEDLGKHSILLPGKNSSLRLKLDEYMESKNISISPVMESGSIDMMLDMIRKGLGIGYLPENILLAQHDKDNFQVLSFNDLPVIDICCMYQEDYLTAATKKFVEAMKEKFHQERKSV